jgi:hypothetical protein
MADTGAVTEFGFLVYAGMIQCKKSIAVKKLRKKKFPRGKSVCRKWLEPCKTRLKPAPMSDKVRKIVEQRILTNLAISRARASVRAAKREKARIEAKRIQVELEQETAFPEPDNPKSSKGSRRPPNLLVVYRNYLERCKAVSHTKIKKFCQESASQNLTYVTAEPGPSSMSDEPNVTCGGQSVKCQDAEVMRKAAGRVMTDESLLDSWRKFGSTGIPKCALKTKDHSEKIHELLNREIDDSEESNQFDQPGTSKQSHLSDGRVFKKPFPVKQKSPRHKTAVKEADKQRAKVRDVLATQRRNVARITKLLSEKGWLQKNELDVRKKRLGKTADLFKTLHDIVLFICEQVSYAFRY